MGQNKYDRLLKLLLDRNAKGFVYADEITSKFGITLGELDNIIQYINDKKPLISTYPHGRAYVGIVVGMTGVVKQFLEDGGFEKENENKRLEEEAIKTQIKYNKEATKISWISLIVAILSLLLTLYNLFQN